MKKEIAKASPGETDERVDMVKVRPNPALFRGCQGQVVVQINGQPVKVAAGTVTEVTAEAYAELQQSEINGQPAVVKA